MDIDVSSTELARNLGDVLARVHSDGLTFLVRKKGKAIARIEPAVPPECATLRDAFAAWSSAAPPDPGFADDIERGRVFLRRPAL
jgi:antitoxin (DNA-binding transcriptional repressor) of toxin-antitoxin stability system